MLKKKKRSLGGPLAALGGKARERKIKGEKREGERKENEEKKEGKRKYE